MRYGIRITILMIFMNVTMYGMEEEQVLAPSESPLVQERHAIDIKKVIKKLKKIKSKKRLHVTIEMPTQLIVESSDQE